MKLIVKHIFSRPAIGKSINQDTIGKSKYGIWILDGISEVKSIYLENDVNAVVWYVNKINEYLERNLDQTDLTISEILSNAINFVRNNTESNFSTNIALFEKYEHPSATIVIARHNDEYIELFSLGDCVVYLQSSQQEILIQNYQARERDRRFLEEILAAKKDYPNLTHSEFLNQINITERLKQLRIELNNQNQYFVLILDPSLITKGFKCNISNSNNILLLSDGFSHVIDTYHLFKDYNDLLVNLEAQGAEQIYRNMRETEQHDPNVQQFPRLRVSDDASLILAYLK